MSFLAANINKDGSKSALALGLIAEIKTIRESGKYATITSNTEVVELSKLISKVVKSNIKVEVLDGTYHYAAITLPLINRENIMFNDALRTRDWGELDGTSVADLYKSSDKVLTGGISKKDECSGYFSKLNTTIYLSPDMLTSTNDVSLEPEELAAIILHEIGHFINFLKATSWTVRGHSMQHQMNEIMMRTSGYKDRIVVLKKIAKEEDIDIRQHIDDLAKSNSSKLTTTVFLAASAKKMRNEMGSNAFDARSFEQLSDNFAAQHGMGLALVLGLEKIPSLRLDKYSSAERTVMNLIKVAYGLLLITSGGSTAGLVLGALISHLLLYNPTNTIYDDPKDRITRVSQTMISTLRQNKDEDNRQLIKDIESVLNVADGFSGARGMFLAISELILPSGRGSKSLRDLNQHLDDFATNKLFISAAKFKNLGR